MKRFILALLVAFSGASFAGVKGGFTAAEDAGIVTPDVATGVREFPRYNNDTNGAMVVCRYDDYERGGGCKNWRLLPDVVPKGKTYVGFRIVSRDYGYRQLELYWK